MKKLFLKLRYLLLAIVMVIACYIYAVMAGNEFTFVLDYEAGASGAAPVVTVEDDGKDILEVAASRFENGNAHITVRSKNPGRAFVSIKDGDQYVSSLRVLFVHRNGIITSDDYFGNFTGSFIVRAGLVIYMAILLMDLIIMYRRGLKKNLYLTRNILTCGLIIFMAGSFLMNLLNMLTVSEMGLYEIFGSFLGFLEIFAIFTMPIAVGMAILATASNIRLLQKEAAANGIHSFCTAIGRDNPASAFLEKAGFVKTGETASEIIYRSDF